MELTNGIGAAPSPAPPWQHTGGVSAVDTGRFAETVATMRPHRPLTKAQIDAVIDELVRARASGADMAGLDPTAPPHVRMPAFGAIMRSAIVRGMIPDTTLTDDLTLQALYDATLGWGPIVQRLLDDPTITEVKINGTTALASGTRGLVVVPNAYATVEEPRSRVVALTQLMEVTWDATHPSVTVPLANKTRLHATRTPLLPDDDLLIVIRRGRTTPWGLPDLVARGALSDEAAALLTTLIQARLSLIVSGAQDSGKTTFLECALNALPPHDHIVLVEDNTDEFCLQSSLVTRLRINALGGDSAFSTVVRETLRMTPSFMAPGEIRGAEAGAIAQIAEAGRPTGTTIHARTAMAAVWRFARLAASDVPGNSFARQPAAALRVIAESFQLIVHLSFAQRLRRRIVQEVALLGGVDTHGDPVFLPLISAQIDSDTTDSVRWTCHAHIVDQALVWSEGKCTTPRVVAALLADSAAGALTTGVSGVVAEEQMRSLLARARELLPYPDQAGQALQYLEQAHDLAPDAREVWALAERLLAHNAALQADMATRVARMTDRLECVVAERDLDAIRVAMGMDSVPLVGQVALARDGRWRAAYDAGMGLLDLVEGLEAALGAATAVAKQKDYAQALRLLRDFSPHALPDTYARRVLGARIELLQAQQEKLGVEGAATLEPQLQQARRQIDALASADGIVDVVESAAEHTGVPSASPHGAGAHSARRDIASPPPPHDPARSSPTDTTERGAAPAAADDLATAAAQSLGVVAGPSPSHGVGQDGYVVQAADAPEPPPIASVVPTGRRAQIDNDRGALPNEAVVLPNNSMYPGVPIRIRAADEVGGFAAVFRGNVPRTQEHHDDSNDA
jgi:pilus assembly protein CpaF